MRKFFIFMMLSWMVVLTALGAQNNQATVHLRGKVLDSTNLPMAATSIKVYKGSSAPKAGAAALKEAQTNETGDFDIEVPSGDYYIDVSAPDFNSFKQSVKATNEMQPLSVTLTVKAFETVVDVSSQANEVGVDPDSSLTTDVISGDALLDLPDNEEDLLAYLQELAAARGIVDGELNIRVDGFENSYLPNKAEIAEIRIINNSFSAESNASGPRIEIVTRPGTGFWTGNLGFNFADESLNARAPLSTGPKPASQTRNFDGQLRGPIIPGRITATFNVQKRESESESNAIRAVTPNGPVDQGISRITSNRTFRFGPNITINKVHSIVANFNYTDSSTANGGIGGFSLPERATDQRGHNWTVQFTERANFSSRLTNEFRVQVRQNHSATMPITNATAINVNDAFNSGGAPNRNASRTMDYVFGNTVRWQPVRKLTLTMAGEADYHKSSSDSRNNYLGTYSFSSLHDYCAATSFEGTQCAITLGYINDANQIQTVPRFCINPNTHVEYSNGACDPVIDENGRSIFINGSPIAITGVPTQFRITVGNPFIDVHQAEFSAYVQGEWRVAPRAQVSFGTRYQVQQHLKDYNNIAPTVGLSYQLSTKQNWQTVVRGGARMNYQTYSMGNWENLLRNGANYQTDYLITTPSFPLPDLSTLVALASTTALRTRADNFVAGYSIQPSFSVDQSLPKGHRVSFNFQISRGVHQSRTRNINAPYPGTPLPPEVLALLTYTNFFNADDQNAKRAEGRAIVDSMRPDSTRGNISQNDSSGSSLVKNFSVQYRIANKRMLGGKVQIGGNVNWSMNWAMDDNATPVNNYDLAAEWGRSNQDQRHRVTASVNILVPWNLRFTFNQLGWNSGRPYNITRGTDLNGDGSINDRPEGFVRNAGTAPDYFNAVNMTVTKTVVLKSRARAPVPANDYVEPQRGGGGFGGGGGGFGGGGGQGGGNGGGRGRPDTRQIQFSVQVTNLFNSTIRTNISGVMSSPLFGQPTGGGAGRTIRLSLQTSLGQLF